jgi:hypothetical protein
MSDPAKIGGGQSCDHYSCSPCFFSLEPLPVLQVQQWQKKSENISANYLDN